MHPNPLGLDLQGNNSMMSQQNPLGRPSLAGEQHDDKSAEPIGPRLAGEQHDDESAEPIGHRLAGEHHADESAEHSYKWTTNSKLILSWSPRQNMI